MNIEDFTALTDRIPGLPLPATPANISLARNFLWKKWDERAEELGKAQPDDLSDSCKFSSQFAAVIFGGELQGNVHHQFTRLPNGKILDLNRFADDVQKEIDHPHVHDPEFFGNPAHEESMNSCRGRVIQWIEEFIQIMRKRGKLHEASDGNLLWNLCNGIRARLKNPAGQCAGAALQLAEQLAAHGIESDLISGKFGDHFHSWVEAGGLIGDPTVDQFVARKQYVSNPGDLPYRAGTRIHFGSKMESLDQRNTTSKPGLFVGVKFSPATVQNLIDWTKANNIEGAAAPASYHTTVIFSRDHKFPYTPKRWTPPLIVNPDQFSLKLFRNHDVLVLTYDCPELDARHWVCRVDNKLTWDYPEYVPHVSLTNLDHEYTGNLQNLTLPDFPLEIISEYVKDFE